MNTSDAVGVTLLVTGALDSLGVPYAIGGSMASIVHGMVRTTMDVDIVADIAPDHVRPFLALLGEDFYGDDGAIREAIDRRRSFNLIHLASMFKVDIFLPTGRAFDRRQLERRIARPVAEGSAARLWLLTPEDLILAKLDWFRQGGEVSERQWRDVLGIIRTQAGSLDTAYLADGAAELGVSDLLNQALTDGS